MSGSEVARDGGVGRDGACSASLRGASPSGVEILEGYLRSHNYDGLCGGGCGCVVGDLAPCGKSELSGCYAGVNDADEARRRGCDFWIVRRVSDGPPSAPENVDREEGWFV